ncbi:hypothetical protein [Streptomyces sp. CoH27]|uniref:hypothetical protein n=1 Tax=Streptomyces sp. CoH27 TaxID=2875763 RepID=UPI001CD37BC3|nr:hypothetical protein [Streptomyces sp. CoH27]
MLDTKMSSRTSPAKAGSVVQNRPVRQPVRVNSSRGEGVRLIVAVALGLGNAWGPYTQSGLTAAHVVAMLMAPVALAAAWRWKMARWNLLLLLVWLFGAAFTEILVGDSNHDVALVLCRPLAVLVSFCGAMWALQCKGVVVRVYVVAFSAGLTCNMAIFMRSHPTPDEWKYGYGPVISLAAVLVASALLARRMRLVGASVVIAVALVSLLLGFRSEFMIVCLAGAVAMLAGRRATRFSWKRSLLITVGLILFAGAVSTIYGNLASQGSLGAEQQYRWEGQSEVQGGVLVGARPEVVASYVIIKESPLIGRGLDPAVSRATRSEFLGKLRAGDVDFNERRENYYFGKGLYLHSILFQTWAETGIAALPGILFPLALVLLALVFAIRVGSGSRALLFGFLLAQLGWDLIFSPWPRLEGIYLGTAAAAALLYRGSSSESRESRMP